MDLTPRERQIIELVALGKTNPEIGTILGVTDNTARNAVNRILLKAGVPNRTCLAVMWVKKHGPW